jgi:protease IV
LVTVADGRFFTGEKAQKMGLVDTMGNFFDAVKIAGELGGIKGEPELVYPEKKWHSVLDVLMESAAGTMVSKFVQQAEQIRLAPVVR